MTTVVEPKFSVYYLVKRVQGESKLVRHRRTMSFISHEIEGTTLNDTEQTRIYAGFQVMSKFLRQLPRYEKLAANAEAIYVFGVADVEPPSIPNMHYIYLAPDDQLAKEWFLVSYGANYISALATEELTRLTDPDEKRLFKGIWTFDTELVTDIERQLSDMVGAKRLPHRKHHYQRQVQLMTQNLERLLARSAQPRAATSTQEELKAVVEEEIRPAIKRLADGG